MKKNRNVSPLIPQVIDCLSGCTKFTIVDICWGYNNIHIKEGDEGKAAFLTLKGLFEPTIMFFELTNSPAIFQMMMNTIFWKEVEEGWLSVYMDNIAIHMARHPHKMEKQHTAHHREYIHQMLDKLKEHDLYLKPEKMPIWEGWDWIPQSHHRKRSSTNEPQKAARDCWLVTTQKPNWSLKLPRVHRILQVLCP